MNGTYLHSEKYLEKYLTRRVQSLGGECIKQTGSAGLPDRLCLLPNGRSIFIELKSKGQKPRALQEFWIRKLTALGFECAWTDSVELINELIY